ncbi:DNA (cytosine-5-)-methyltransferase [Macrococcus lamae]|uniref:Cytosine-specific methyltransferase n=2 Tax=Macrococcus lamae TaxID=198484 RepID=A0A4R6BTB8_9STAP|nr:DNA (cytosine-5-)-methyltransferase [Macrococcus lamae]
MSLMNKEDKPIQDILREKILEEYNDIAETNQDLEILNNISYRKDKINVISLFSGCGGMDLGLLLSGIKELDHLEFDHPIFKEKSIFDSIINTSIYNINYSNDMFKEANESYIKNMPATFVKDSRDIRSIKYFPKSDLIIGGFPCPGFSEAGPRLIDDERNFLYIHFIRCITQSKPAIFVAENVKGMLSLGQGEVIKQITQDFAAAGYRVDYKLLNARDYGVPQYRQRVFIVGIRNDIKFKYAYPNPTHGENDALMNRVTLKDAIYDLNPEPGPYFEGSFSSIYMSRNRKKEWEDQSFTIQASGRQAPLHPSGDKMVKLGPDKWSLPGDLDNHRRLSVKEIKRIQTFPDWYYISPGNNNVNLNSQLNRQYTQIGNAVPVILAKKVFMPITEFFTESGL